MKGLPALFMLALTACSAPEDEAAVVLYDRSYALETVLDTADGITSPDGLLWHDGVLYIADEGGSAIRKWDVAELTTLADAASGILSPEDLRIGGDGRLYFTDDSAGGLWRVLETGGAERVADAAMLEGSEGIAVAPDGGVEVGSGETGRIAHVQPGGAVEAYLGRRWGIAKPESMVRAPDGSLLVADNREDRLVRITSAGTVRELALPDDLSPESIALSGDVLWITDSHNGRLYRMERDQPPETVALFLGTFANINGVAAAGDGTIYISIQSDLEAGEGYIVRLVPRTAGAEANGG